MVSGRIVFVWVAHASRVLVSASRRNNLFWKVRAGETPSPARETRALPGQQKAWLEITAPSTDFLPGCSPLLGAPNLYVQPRSRKNKSRTGIGIPRSHSKIYPAAPVSLICSFSFMPIVLPHLLFVRETADGCVENKKSALVRLACSGGL